MESSVNAQNEEVEARMRLVAQQLQLETRIRNGANWFFWIAGLSAVNTVLELAGGGFRFTFGLGITQFIDVVASLLADDLTPLGGHLITGASVFINLAILSIFVGVGVFARKKNLPAFYIGTGLYVLDGIILAVIGDFLGFAFHILATLGILQGIRSLREFRQLPSDEMETQERVDQLLDENVALTKNEVRGKKFIQILAVLVVIVFIVFLCLLATFLL